MHRKNILTQQTQGGIMEYTYEGKAKKVGRTIGENEIVTEICVWTDGLSLCADNDRYCAYPLDIGVRYRVTVERLDPMPVPVHETS